MSPIQATEKNIEWLMERLYEARRTLEACQESEPTFVLLTKDKDDRHRVEQIFYSYFIRTFGPPACFEKGPQPVVSTYERGCTAFFLPTINTHILLMDI